jgi:ABC-type multidrug transport system permease subunit
MNIFLLFHMFYKVIKTDQNGFIKNIWVSHINENSFNCTNCQNTKKLKISGPIYCLRYSDISISIQAGTSSKLLRPIWVVIFIIVFAIVSNIIMNVYLYILNSWIYTLYQFLLYMCVFTHKIFLLKTTERESVRLLFTDHCNFTWFDDNLH